MASVCPKCGKVNFPPRLLCDEDQTESEWKELDSIGRIVELTAGKDARGDSVCFALVRMNEASNLCLARLDGDDFDVGDEVRIHALELANSHPTQNVIFRRV